MFGILDLVQIPSVPPHQVLCGMEKIDQLVLLTITQRLVPRMLDRTQLDDTVVGLLVLCCDLDDSAVFFADLTLVEPFRAVLILKIAIEKSQKAIFLGAGESRKSGEQPGSPGKVDDLKILRLARYDRGVGRHGRGPCGTAAPTRRLVFQF